MLKTKVKLHNNERKQNDNLKRVRPGGQNLNGRSTTVFRPCYFALTAAATTSAETTASATPASDATATNATATNADGCHSVFLPLLYRTKNTGEHKITRPTKTVSMTKQNAVNDNGNNFDEHTKRKNGIKKIINCQNPIHETAL
jgi:hypothetical protein